MKPKMIIAGANGFLGKELIHFFYTTYSIITLTRQTDSTKINGVKNIQWDGKNIGEWSKEMEDSEVLINLAGKSVNCRYNKSNKAALFQSRLESTRILQKAISQYKNPPKIWLNSSSATIYAHSLERMNDENGVIGEGFSVEVCKAWEAEFFRTESPNTKKVALRSSIVLGTSGGVFPELVWLVKKNIGGKMGSGNQKFSWIHIHDFCRAIEHIIQRKEPKKIYNLAAPHPVTNKELHQLIVRQLKPTFALPLPKTLLKIGAIFLKTETELVLKSRNVISKQLKEEAFLFDFSTIDESVLNLLNK